MPTTFDDRDLTELHDVGLHFAIEHVEGFDGGQHVGEGEHAGQLVLAEPERGAEIECPEQHLPVPLLAGLFDGPLDDVVADGGDRLPGELVHGQHRVGPREHAGDRGLTGLMGRDRELGAEQPHQPLGAGQLERSRTSFLHLLDDHLVGFGISGGFLGHRVAPGRVEGSSIAADS